MTEGYKKAFAPVRQLYTATFTGGIERSREAFRQGHTETAGGTQGGAFFVKGSSGSTLGVFKIDEQHRPWLKRIKQPYP